MYQPLSAEFKVVKNGKVVFVGTENDCDSFAQYNANGGPDCEVLPNG